MSEHVIHDLREAQLRFIGKILATLSHELKNHLAIIKEFSGLIQDLAEVEKTPAEGPAGQYVSSVRSIHRQIDKTLELLRYFSRFSHRMDASRSVYGVNEAVEELLALIHRIANQKKILLETDFHEALPQITGNPALLQFSLFRLIEDAMGRFEKNGSLVLRTELTGAAITITLIVRGELNSGVGKHPAGPDEACREALRCLGGEISRSAGGEATLTIPLASITTSARKSQEPVKEQQLQGGSAHVGRD